MRTKTFLGMRYKNDFLETVQRAIGSFSALYCCLTVCLSKNYGSLYKRNFYLATA